MLDGGAKRVVNLQTTNNGRNYTRATQRRCRAPVDKEFEELVEAREQAWDRQIKADAEAGKGSTGGRSAARLSRREVQALPSSGIRYLVRRHDADG
jgi:hypothetical protein